MIEILLIDDHHLVREGLCLLLDSHPRLSIVTELGSAEKALEYLEENKKPELILTDIVMDRMDGISFVRIVKKIYPEIKVAILSMIEDKAKVTEAFVAGADGYLSKGTDYDELLFGVLQIAKGHKYVTASLSLRFLEDYLDHCPVTVDPAELLQRYDISERELEVLKMISEGYTNAEIANKVFLSKRTVEGHRQHLMEKTNTRNTADLVRFGFQKKLLQ
ncbi:response regulator transcription factor [Sphingobacterium sp.]|uniref:response regulator transcription factor n=1 Tax=Sphingobacterium sp. TaxID=341027 RepID=UPI0031DD359C